jgi:hypothetical protein
MTAEETEESVEEDDERSLWKKVVDGIDFVASLFDFV